MRILFLNNYYYIRGGSERVFFGEMDLMKKHGHVTAGFARQYPLDVTAEYARFFPQNIITEKITVSWKAVKTLKEIVYSVSAKDSLNRLISEFDPDIAHVHNMYGRLTTSILDVLTQRNVPAIMTLHDYKLCCPSYKFMCSNRICEDCKGGRYYMAVKNRCHKESYAASAVNALESYFNDWFDKYKKNICFFISPSRFLRNKFIEFGWPEKQIKFVPNFLDLSQFEPNYTPGNYFLYIGRLSEEKGVATLIDAFRQLTNAQAELLVAGDGPIRNRLENVARSNPRIRFLGHLSGQILSELTRNALAVVVPSEWYENAPISIIESMAYGKPVIGAAIGGIPEMIQDGENGQLFEPGNYVELETVLKRFGDLNPDQIVEMGKKGREQAERENGLEDHYQNLMDIYQEASHKAKR